MDDLTNAELDHWLSVNVLGGHEPTKGWMADRNRGLPNWSPTTNANDAMEVLERVLSERIQAEIKVFHDGAHAFICDCETQHIIVMSGTPGPDWKNISTWKNDPTFPLAVSRVVHKLVSEGKWQPETEG